MVIKIKHLEDGDTFESVLDVMYAEALDDNILRLWSTDGDHCDCTEISLHTYDISTPFTDKAIDVVNKLFNIGKCQIEAFVHWN